MSKTTKRFALTTILVAIVGYVVGILTAPKSGKETRADIKETAEKTYAEAEKQLKRLHTELSQTLDEAKKQVELLKGKAREELEMAVSVAQKAKEKARDVLGAAHEGEAEDKDLQKAVADAVESLNYLKKFLKK